MLKKAAIVAGTAAGMMALAPMANADSMDNDGVNILNGNDLSLLPIQACGNNIAVLGVILPIGSPQAPECSNAPVTDHPSVEN